MFPKIHNLKSVDFQHLHLGLGDQRQCRKNAFRVKRQIFHLRLSCVAITLNNDAQLPLTYICHQLNGNFWCRCSCHSRSRRCRQMCVVMVVPLALITSRATFVKGEAVGFVSNTHKVGRISIKRITCNTNREEVLMLWLKMLWVVVTDSQTNLHWATTWGWTKKKMPVSGLKKEIEFVPLLVSEWLLSASTTSLQSTA